MADNNKPKYTPSKAFQEVLSGQYKESPMAAAVAKRKRNEPYEVTTVDYDVPFSAVYDRLNDGSYVAKYENYLGAEGNEERLAKQQTSGEKWKNGLIKNTAKVFTYATDALVGTMYGLGKSITSGDFSDMYDNELTSYLDDANKTLDNSLANHYTQEEKAMSFFEKMGTANFWANDVAGGLAFVGGAVLSEGAVALLTGGTSLGVTGAKIAAKIGGKAIVKEGTEKAGKSILKSLYKSSRAGKYTGDVVGTAASLLRTSNFEAGMEARQNFKQAVDNYLENFENLNGRQPTYEEQKDFFNKATSAANGVYTANMGILAVSNAIMFGKKIIPDSITKFGNKYIGGTVDNLMGFGTKRAIKDGVVSTTMKTANLGQKALFTTSKLAGKAVSEGIFEEGFQGVAGKTMQKYLESKYDPKALDGYDAWSSLYDSFAEQYNSKEGWTEMGIGMIIGMAGGAVNPKAIKSGTAFPGLFKNSWKAEHTRRQTALTRSNQGLEALAALNRTSAANKLGKQGMDFEADVVGNLNYIRSQEGIKDKHEIIEDYNDTIDALDFENNKDLADAVESLGITPEEYKAQQKQDFQKFYEKSYYPAYKTLERLGIPDMVEIQGNKYEVADNLLTSFVAGHEANRRAQDLGEQLATDLGRGGLYDAYAYYHNLSEENQALVNEYQEGLQRMKELQDQAIATGQEMAKLNSEKPQTETDIKVLEARKNEISQKVVMTQEALNKTNARIEELKGHFDNIGDINYMKFEGLSEVGVNPTIEDVVSKIESVNNHIDLLNQNGRNKEAKELEFKIRSLQANIFAHKEMQDNARRMMDTGFFTSEKGKRLTDKILGKKYAMSDDLREALKNDRGIILNQLSKFMDIEDLVDNSVALWEKMIANNAELSDREKHRIESIVLLNLSAHGIQRVAESLQKTSAEVTTSEIETNTNTLEGDTVTLKTSIELNKTKFDNVQELDKVINTIVDELNYIINKSSNNEEKLAELNTQLEELKKQREQLTQGTSTNTEAQKYDIERRRQEEIDNIEEDTSFNPKDREGEKRARAAADRYKAKEKEINAKYDAELEQLNQSVQQNQAFTDTEQLEKVNTEIQDIENQIAEINKGFDIMDSESYRRFEELTAKFDRQETTPQEEAEIEKLRNDLDQWTYITGIVVQGFRLSDLIQQKSVLENTPIETIEAIELATTEDVLEQAEFDDVTKRANYSLGVTYDKVVVSKSDGDFVIHNMTDSQFEELVGDIEVTRKPDTTGKNNIVLSEEDFQKLPVKLYEIKTNARNYSPLLEETIDKDNNKTLALVDSEQKVDEEHNIAAVYNTTAGDKVTISVDIDYPYNQEIIKQYREALSAVVNKPNPSKKAKANLVEALNRIRKDLNISVFNGNAKIATLKGSRRVTLNNSTDIEFENLRAAISESPEFLDMLLDPNQKGFVNVQISNEDGDFGMPEITVKKVFLGFPNLNYAINENGEAVIESRPVGESEVGLISDIGYVLDGKPNTRTKEPVDLTFVSGATKRSPKSKIPIIVLTIGGKRVAYPVKVGTEKEIDTQEFEDIYNNQNLTDNEKAMLLNKWMAAHGIDIKKSGNAFISFGDSNINDDTFFSEKLAQLKRINYFYDVTLWTDSNNSMEEIIKNQISVDINLKDPVHSPKVQFDYSKLNLRTASPVKPATNNAANVKSNPQPSKIFNCK